MADDITTWTLPESHQVSRLAATDDLLTACLAALLFLGATRWTEAESARWAKLVRSNEPPTPKTLRAVLRAAVEKATEGDA